ncbi:MAG: DUF4038 domain-containing protein [Armatimonadota bacterium]|nr:DUF4038 domain-containing protein [Armatimonadota bacterium]
MLTVQRNCVAEWSLGRQAAAGEPSGPIDVRVTTPDGGELVVPAFRDAAGLQRVRYSSAQLGRHRWRVEAPDDVMDGLHASEGELEVIEYEGDNALLARGPLQVADSARHLQHADGTPFLWLADTWWMALCSRLHWPGEFQRLAADRVEKGFNVVQLVAGLYPDMAAFDRRGDNEAGWPWHHDWAGINPGWWDLADLRIEWLVSRGLMPCIFGSWGYYLPWMGVDRLTRHWREMVARWGAHPVVWCLAGEGAMPWYLHKRTEQAEEDARIQREGWTEVARRLRAMDPYQRLITIHPTRRGREQVTDESVLDLEMLQTGHGDRGSLPGTVRAVREARADTPAMPVINGEVCYEGILEGSRQEVQRMMFWASFLTGTCGHTYGANGIWQVNREGAPYGASPHGFSWGDTPWTEAMHLPGSAQLGRFRRLLERWEWWRIEPHPEWVEPHAGEESFSLPYAAGIPGELRVIYLFNALPQPTIRHLEPGLRYRATLIDPTTGEERDHGVATADEESSWPVPQIEVRRDWLLVLESA